jgi:proline dehydrogenase
LNEKYKIYALNKANNLKSLIKSDLHVNLQTMLDFSNTEIAFESKSNADLNRSYWLFNLIGKPTLVNIGSSLTTLAIKIHLPIKGLIKATIFKQFVGGETIEECSKAVSDLGLYKIGSILDYSVEGKESEAEFDHCLEETLDTIEKAKNDSHIPFCVFKVTGLARFALLEKISANETLTADEHEEWKRVEKRVDTICKRAATYKQCLFIDAEESWIQAAIDQLADSNMAMYNKEKAIVYNTFQLYRHDRLVFLKSSVEKGASGAYHVGAKLVRGAYMEKEGKRAEEKGYLNPIQNTKENTDRDYNEALEFCMQQINRMSICAGTHNESSSLLLAELMKKYQVLPNDKRVYFSQLLGMSDHISFNLAKAGYNVAKYVPYGPVNDTLPYLIRRAQENTSVKGQTGRELNLIIKERQRRKLAK